jgi:hypothetical protein
MRRDLIKTIFLIAAILAALYCARRADDLDKQARSISDEIATKRGAYVGDAAATNGADKVVESLQEDHKNLILKSQELNHLFTYVISGFLGLAISVAADLLGQPNPNVPPPVKAQGSQ